MDTETPENVKVTAATFDDAPTGSESFFLENLQPLSENTFSGTVANVLAFTGFSLDDEVIARLPEGAQPRPHVTEVVKRSDYVTVLIGVLDNKDTAVPADDPRAATVLTALQQLQRELSTADCATERWMNDVLIASIPGPELTTAENTLDRAINLSGAHTLLDKHNLGIIVDILVQPSDPVGVPLPLPAGYNEQATETPYEADMTTVVTLLDSHPFDDWITNMITDGYASKDIDKDAVWDALGTLLRYDDRAVPAVERGDGKSLTIVALRMVSVDNTLPLGPCPSWMNY